MSTLSNPEIDLDTVNPETVTVSDLISALRFAFQPENYKKVEEILVAREKKLNEEIQNWERKYDLEERAHSMAQLNYIVTDEQLVKLKQELRVKTEEVTRLREDKKLDDTRVVLYEERDKRVRAENDKIFGENQKLIKEIRELKLVLELAKIKDEKELATAERRNKENELRVTRLEEELEALTSQPTLQPKVEKKEDFADANGAPGGTRSGNSSVDTNMVGPSGADAGFVIRPCGEGDSSHKNKRQKTCTDYITISDSDDNIPRQAHTPNVPSVAVSDPSLKEKETKTSTLEQSGGGNRIPDVPSVAAPDLSMEPKETRTSTTEQPDGGNQTPNVTSVTVPDVPLEEKETKTSTSEQPDGGSGSNRKTELFLGNVERENDFNTFDLLLAFSSSSSSSSSDFVDSDSDIDAIRRLLS